MGALLVLGAIIALIAVAVIRTPILRALFMILIPMLLPRIFSPRRPQGNQGNAALSDEEARSILGVGPYASRDEIIEAHHRLMKHMHPDHGGSGYFAARINMARDVLLKDAGVTIENTPH